MQGSAPPCRIDGHTRSCRSASRTGRRRLRAGEHWQWNAAAPPVHASLLRRWTCWTWHPAGSRLRSEEHTSELQSLMRISYAVFCLKKKTKQNTLKISKYKD